MIAKTLMPRRFYLLLPLLFAGFAQAWAAHPEESAFLAARDAYAKGQRDKLERALAGLKTHPLAPWAEHFRLALQLEDGSDAGVAEFVQQHDGSYLAEKTRTLWLRALARKEDWQQARQLYLQLRRPDTEATCLGIDAGLHLDDPQAVAEARAVLNGHAPLTEACAAPLGRLAAAGALPADEIRARLRRQLARGRLKEARLLAGWLADAPAWKDFEAVAEHPARHLARLPENFADSAGGRELAMFAVLRMAKSEARVAAARWQGIESHFDEAERGYVWGQLALIAALGHLAEATEWFDRAAKFGASFDEEQQAWRVRAALRAGDWPAVARAIDALPPSVAALPEWTYWRGRAHAAAGAAESARQMYARIAGQPNFYGILAAEALGQSYTLPPRAAPPSIEELAAVAAMPGLERGLALIRAGLRLDGIREWNWSIADFDDRQLLAAAELARRAEVIDRAINTADRTRAEHDFSLRYPTPFYAAVEPRIRTAGLDPAWVYGLMRQESRFIMDAKSSVGAKGLMQLMPATAKWVAKKIGMTHFHPKKIAEMDINVTLGTSYLRMVMDSLAGHPLLASAAYNAGPGRARKWRAEVPLEGAIYAETIPFSETRDYVKKVMANTINYAILLGAAAPSLTELLTTVPPRGFDDRSAEDLP